MSSTIAPWYALEFLNTPRWLQVSITGVGGDLCTTCQWWRDVADRLWQTGKRQLLMLNHTCGGGLCERDHAPMIADTATHLPAGCKIAVVYDEMAQLLAAERMVMGSGDTHRTMLFQSRQQAETWLRYGCD